jgi:hypothetical protein
MMMTMMTLHLYWFDLFFFCVFHFQKEKVYEWMGGGCFFVLLLLALTEALCTFFALLISCLCLSLLVSLSVCVCVVCCDCELIPIYFYLVFFYTCFCQFQFRRVVFFFYLEDCGWFLRIWARVVEGQKKNRLHPSIYHENSSENLCCLSVYALKLPLLLHQTSGGKKRHQQIK